MEARHGLEQYYRSCMGGHVSTSTPHEAGIEAALLRSSYVGTPRVVRWKFHRFRGVACRKAWLTRPAFVLFFLSRQVTYHIAIDAASISRDLGAAMGLFREMRARCVRPRRSSFFSEV